MRCDYAVTIDQAGELATVKFLNLSGTQNSQLFLQSELPSPLTLAWGVAKGNASDGIFMLTVTGWNLADWRRLQAAAPTGVMNTKTETCDAAGWKKLRLELDGGVDKFSAKSGDDQMNRWKSVGFGAGGRGRVAAAQAGGLSAGDFASRAGGGDGDGFGHV